MSDDDHRPYMVKLPLGRVRQLPSQNKARPQHVPGPARHSTGHSATPVAKGVTKVVNSYLKQVDKEQRQAWLAPEKLCACCRDINQINIDKAKESEQKRKTLSNNEIPLPADTQHMMAKPGNAPQTKRVQFKDEADGYGLIHRSPTPDLTDDYPADVQSANTPRKVYLTHPSQDVLLSEWNMEMERYTYSKDRRMAEVVVEASSNLEKSLKRLQNNFT